MIQRVQTDKVVAVSTISTARYPLSVLPSFSSASVVSFPSPFLLLQSAAVRWTKISHRTFIKFDRECTRESLKRRTKINEMPDPTLTHYRQVLCSLSQKINGLALFRIRMRHHSFRFSTFGPIVPITIDFCFPSKQWSSC